MKRKAMRRTAAALLALVLALSLAACGRGGEDGGASPAGGGDAQGVFAADMSVEALGDKLYVPEEVPMPDGLRTAASVAATPDGETMYLTDARQEQVSVTHNGYTTVEYRYIYRLLRMDTAGGELKELPNYHLPEIPADACGSESVSVLRVQDDGSLWVRENVQWYYLNVPADFDPDKDDARNYRTEAQGGEAYLLLDSEGTELKRVDLTAKRQELGEDPEDPFDNYRVTIDRAGNFCLVNNEQVHVLDPDLNLLFSLEGKNMNNAAVVLSNGALAVQTYVDGGPGGGSGEQLRVIDLEKRDWGDGVELPGSVYNVYGGSGRFLFFYNTGLSLYGWDRAAGEGVELLDWITTGLNQSVHLLAMLADGRLVLLTRGSTGYADEPPELSLCTATDRSEVAVSEKKVLIYGTFYLGSEAQQAIQKFNRTNDEYVIQPRVYYDLAGGDYEAARTMMQTEIQAGNIPDILNAMNVDITLLGRKGYLEDLWPWIDQDPELGRENLMTHVLDAVSQDGKLYQAFSQFEIDTVMGPVSAVGDRLSWSLADVIALNDSLPDGVTLFGPRMTSSSMFYWAAPQVLDSFVDWETGECSFESDAFKQLLEFCALFPTEEPPDDGEFSGTYDRIAAGRRLLAHNFIISFGDFQTYPQMWGEDVACIGYPTADGSCGSSFGIFDISGAVAISAACPYKEAAWSFVRQKFLPQLQEGDHHDALFINKHDFDYALEQAMTPVYDTFPDGTLKLDKNGNPRELSMSSGSMDGVPYTMYALKQEEADQFMALYNAVERSGTGSGTIQSIVAEMAGPYFAGDRGLDETCSLIQGRVSLYVNENR